MAENQSQFCCIWCRLQRHGHCRVQTIAIGGDWMPSIIDAKEVISQTAETGLSSIGDIILCHCPGLFGHVARLDSTVPAKDALECAYARRTKIRPLSGWRRPPGRPVQTWLHQIGDGSTASIRQEWVLAVGCGHSRRTRSALRASAAQAF